MQLNASSLLRLNGGERKGVRTGSTLRLMCVVSGCGWVGLAGWVLVRVLNVVVGARAQRGGVLNVVAFSTWWQLAIYDLPLRLQTPMRQPSQQPALTRPEGPDSGRAAAHHRDGGLVGAGNRDSLPISNLACEVGCGALSCCCQLPYPRASVHSVTRSIQPIYLCCPSRVPAAARSVARDR